mgnify:CR=1 FL=1
MLRIVEIIATPLTDAEKASSLILTLPFEMRQKSRFRAVLDDGTEVGLFLNRGQVMRSGDYLRAEDGQIFRVEAADETVSTVRHEDMFEIARCAYHLGNRHVALQVGRGWLRYLHDHVLDEMVIGLGVEVVIEAAPFEPEGGAYGGHSHSHDHVHEDVHQGRAHSHSESHSHSHTHSNGHSNANHHTHTEAHSHSHTHVKNTEE